MNEAIRLMLQRYKCTTASDYESALKEIIQEIALLGLWRAKFFEHAAFYGGSALRILYGLNRFSEDLDFSLVKEKESFSLSRYHTAVKAELLAFGFEARVTSISKTQLTPIESAFIKADTLSHLINVGVPDSVHKLVQKNKVMAIKFEIDTKPSLGFEIENRSLLQPIPFNINTYSAPDLFAGKMHCVLCRAWKTRVKGRDWYDMVWFVAQGIPLRLKFLQSKLILSKVLSQGEELSVEALKKIYQRRVEALDVERAQDDVRPFLQDPDSTKIWSHEFFTDLFFKIRWV